MSWNPIEAARTQTVLQLCPFHEERDAFLAAAKVSLDDLDRWHKCGWVSFDPRDRSEFYDPETFKILFMAQVRTPQINAVHLLCILFKVNTCNARLR